ncbi:MAG: hypothetical protein HY903_22655 [Deltaproteobacteria bacterium]|nr:hypothetical protein [Deltaproteobacteria bacterium]
MDGDEQCDPAIASGIGACPLSCDDEDACTRDDLVGVACQQTCAHEAITSPLSGDHCCPAGANANSDRDCPAVCDNGLVEPGESCDTAITGGAGACPALAQCDDHVACTRDEVVTTRGEPCSAVCGHVVIDDAGGADGCCPQGATAATDPDCSAACGDGVVQSNETCDVGIASGPGRCPTASSCADQDACSVDQLLGAGTCSAECMHTPITGTIGGDGCCPQAGTPRSADWDCPSLPLYYGCALPSDCASALCLAFDQLEGMRACTAHCDPNIASLAANCPAVGADGFEPLCLNYPVYAGTRQDVCLALAAAPDADGSYLYVDATYVGTLRTSDEADLYFVGADDLGAGHDWVITAQGAAGVDLVLVATDEALMMSSWANNTGPGQVETLYLSSRGSERSFFWVTSSQSRIGSYSLMATLR